MKPEWADYADRTESGWRTILDALAANLGEKTNSRKPNAPK
ncbi:MAG: hypothetical protein Q7S40_07600 [Opitutaceae bacterium]|nr:hypothetical protein [Opitutaceae bacterium]